MNIITKTTLFTLVSLAGIALSAFSMANDEGMGIAKKLGN
jgi:hypothetical protein